MKPWTLNIFARATLALAILASPWLTPAARAVPSSAAQDVWCRDDSGYYQNDSGLIRQTLEDDRLSLETGGRASLPLPTPVMPLAVMVHNQTRVASQVMRGDSENGQGGSRLLGDNLALNEAGLVSSKALFGQGDRAYRLDASLKAQRLDRFQYDVPNYSQRHGLNATVPSTYEGVNLDLGLHKSFGGLATRVLYTDPMAGEQGHPLERPHRLEAGAGWDTRLDNPWLATGLELDWTTLDPYGDQERLRFADTRVHFPEGPLSPVSLGYHYPLGGQIGEATRPVASLGLDMSIFDGIELNLTGRRVSGGTYSMLGSLFTRF